MKKISNDMLLYPILDTANFINITFLYIGTTLKLPIHMISQNLKAALDF